MVCLDTYATLNFFYPLKKIIGDGGKTRIPILMYHSISGVQEAGHPYWWTKTAPDVFAAHMRFLYASGYQAVGLPVAADWLAANRQPVEAKPVILTFDDGYRDFYTQAFPILRQYNFSATVFLATAFIGKSRTGEGSYLDWDEIRDLRHQGIGFGSHTVNHPKLITLKPEDIQHEICSSKFLMEERLGESIDSFSFPFAFPEADTEFRKRMRTLLAKCGYRVGVTTIVGCTRQGDDPFFLRRLPINSRDDLSIFKAKLEGGYDWMHPLQYASKALREKVFRKMGYIP